MVSTASEVVGECGGVTANGYGGSSGVMKIKLIMVMVTQVREYTKNPLNRTLFLGESHGIMNSISIRC